MELPYLVTLSKKASNDLIKLRRSGKGEKAEALLDALTENPFSLKYEKLKGEAEGLFSVRINAVDRLVFEIDESHDERYKGIVNVIRMRTHYKGILSIFLL
jgi:Txe/YoeB family toxin of toxin-antitoxin system